MRRFGIVGAAAAVALIVGAALWWWLQPGMPPPAPPLRPHTATPTPRRAVPPAKPVPQVPPRPGRQSDWDKASVGSHADAVQACADQHSATPPGNLRLQVRLAADGSVKEIEVTDRKFRDLEVAECVADALGGKRFPPGAEDRKVTHIFRVR